MQSHKPSVLIVDDDDHLLRCYQSAAQRWGYDVQIASDGASALAKFNAGDFDVVVSDVAMPGMDGLALLEAVRKKDADIPVILVTGQPDLSAATKAVEHGAFRYLSKPVETSTLEETVRRALRVQYAARAKRRVADTVSSVASEVRSRAGLEAPFASAMERLWIAYQPIVSWSTRSVYGYEALVRSSEPRMPSPPQILEAAERLGKLMELGRAIRKQVASDAVEAPEHAKLFVNLHSADLADDDLFEEDAPLGRISGRVVLEVTERASLDAVANVNERVRKLRAIGYKLAVDDLGAGYAGLTSFTLLDPDMAKIDMSLVRGIATDPRRQAIVDSLLKLCRDLRMTVVAEGVETVLERDALIELGCDMFQGYFFAKPGRGFPAPAWDG